MKIISDDGHEFKTIDECNAYEANQKLLKQKEEAERKTKEEARKKLMAEKKSDFDKVLGFATKFNESLNEYKKKYGGAFYVNVTDNGIVIKETDSLGDLFDNIVAAYRVQGLL